MTLAAACITTGMPDSPCPVESDKHLTEGVSIGITSELNPTVVTGTTDKTGFFSDAGVAANTSNGLVLKETHAKRLPSPLKDNEPV